MSTKATLVTKANKATLVTKPNVATLVTRPNRATVSGSPSLIGQSVGFWRADQYDAGNDVLSDLSGQGRHARLGSAVGADAADPVRLVPVGGKRYLWLPGTAGNSASTPDHPSTDVAGDFEIMVDAAPADVTGTTPVFLSTGGVELFRQSDGHFRLIWWLGGVQQNRVSTAALPSASGERISIRGELDADNGAGQHVVKFWLFRNGAWSQLGSDVTAGGAAVVGPGAALAVGVRLPNNFPYKGAMFRASLSDGIGAGGTTVFDADFTDPNITEPFNSFVESTGKTVTINRTASGLVSTVVDRPMLVHDGAAHYSEVPDHGSLDFAADAPFSIAAAVRPQDATPSAAQVLLAKKTNLTTGAGYALYVDPTGVPKCVIADGTNSTVATGPALPGDRRATVVAAVRDPVTDKLTVYTDGVAGTPVTDTTTGAISNAEVLRLGRLSGAGTSYLWGELFGAGVWNKALAPGDVAALSGIMKLTPA